MATALLVITAVSAVAGAVQQRNISRAQKRQNRISNRVAAITRQRNIKRSIAAQRIQVAQQQALGFQLGVSGSTAVQGATAGIIGDLASSIGQSNLQFTGQQFIAQQQNRISTAQQAQAGFSALSSLSGSLANNPQAVSSLTNLVE